MKKLTMLALAMLFASTSAFGVQGLRWNKSSFDISRNTPQMLLAIFKDYVVGDQGQSKSKWYAQLDVSDSSIAAGFGDLSSNGTAILQSATHNAQMGLSSAEAGHILYELFDKDGLLQASFDVNIKKPVQNDISSTQKRKTTGAGMSLALKTAPALTDQCTATALENIICVHLDPVEFANGRLDMTLSGFMSTNTSKFWYCGNEIGDETNCLESFAKIGGESALTGSGSITIEMPFLVETIPS